MTRDKKGIPENIPKIFDKTPVKSYRYGDTLEMTTSIGKQTIMVLPGKRYVVLETGEIKDMDVSSLSREDNLKSVRNTMKKLRRLITHNFHGKKNELWITLTYKEHVTDSKEAYNHFKIFMRRMRESYGSLEYISVIEPQASGRWHYHVLIKSDDESERLYIPNEELALMWGRGFTKTKRLKSSDKVGNYVIAYLTDLKIPEENATTDKKYIKGARLHLYPKGLRIYRCSRGIVQPYEETNIKETILEKNKIDRKIKSNFSRMTKHKDLLGNEIVYITEFYNDLKE